MLASRTVAITRSDRQFERQLLRRFSAFSLFSFTQMRRVPDLARGRVRTAVVAFPLMPCRERPVVGVFDQSMFHRVPVDIVYMRVEVVMVADQMLPIAPLPDAALALSSPLSQFRREGDPEGRGSRLSRTDGVGRPRRRPPANRRYDQPASATAGRSARR